MMSVRKKLLPALVAIALLLGAGAAVWRFQSALVPDWLETFAGGTVLWQTDPAPMKVVVPFDMASKDPVKIEVSTPRLYGLRIGQPVRVRYVMTTLSGNKVNFETLKVGVLSRDASTWRMAGKPVISQVKKEGFTTYTVEITVACWEPPAPPVPPATADNATAGGAATGQPAAAQAAPAEPRLWPFQVEFLLSTDKQENGQPVWQYVETPPVQFGFSSSVEPDAKVFDFGPMGDIPFRLLTSAVTVAVLAALMVLCGASFWAYRLVRAITSRLKPEPLPEGAVRFWQAMAAADSIRLSRGYVGEVHVAFRQYLGDATIPSPELASRWVDNPRHGEIVRTLDILDRALHNPNDVSTLEWRSALAFMQELIPSSVEKRRFFRLPVIGRWLRVKGR